MTARNFIHEYFFSLFNTKNVEIILQNSISHKINYLIYVTMKVIKFITIIIIDYDL